jgi:hypothetical protein
MTDSLPRGSQEIPGSKRHACPTSGKRDCLSVRRNVERSSARANVLAQVLLSRVRHELLRHESGAVVVEGIMNGRHYRGRIVRDAGGDLQFEVDFQPDMVTVIWQPATGMLTFVGVPGNDARPTTSSRCEGPRSLRMDRNQQQDLFTAEH